MKNDSGNLFANPRALVPGATNEGRPCKTDCCPNMTEVVEWMPRVPTPWLDAADAVMASLSAYCEKCVAHIKAMEERAEAEAEAKRRLAARGKWWRDIWGGESSIYHQTAIGRLPDPKASSNVLRWKLDLPKGVLCSGETGTGKTRTIYLLLKEILFEHGVYPTIRKCSLLRGEITKAAMKGEEYKAALLRELVECRLLYLDDLGQMATSPAAVEFLFALVDERTNRGLPIIATTQHTGDSFAALFAPDVRRGEAIGRRLGEFSYKIYFSNTRAPQPSEDLIP